MKFKKAYVEITNACNLSCEFCKRTEREKHFMSLNNFERVISELAPYTNYVYLHVLGEPMLHPQLDKILEACEQKNIRVNITTNGTLISKLSDTLLRSSSVRQINFSLHSMSINNESLLEEILNFAGVAGERIYIVLRVWIINEETQKLLKKIAAYFNLNTPIPMKALPGNGFQISKNIFVQLNTEFTWPDINGAQIFTSGKCYALKDQIAILVDGTVVPCCLDCDGNLALGNIFETPLHQILCHERVKNMRDGFNRRVVTEDFCKSCGFGVRLNG